MKYDHPHIIIAEPVRGYYVIENLNAAAVLTPEGWLAGPGSIVIPPEAPSDLLRAILAAREEKGGVEGSSAAAFETEDLLCRILAAVSEKAKPLGKLAEMLKVEPGAIVALDGQGFAIGDSGPKWVKLAAQEGGAE